MFPSIFSSSINPFLPILKKDSDMRLETNLLPSAWLVTLHLALTDDLHILHGHGVEHLAGQPVQRRRALLAVAGLALLAIAGFFWYLTGPAGYAANDRVVVAVESARDAALSDYARRFDRIDIAPEAMEVA